MMVSRGQFCAPHAVPHFSLNQEHCRCRSKDLGILRRLLESIGLQRRTRDVTPSLADYLEQQQQTIDT